MKNPKKASPAVIEAIEYLKISRKRKGEIPRTSKSRPLSTTIAKAFQQWQKISY